MELSFWYQIITKFYLSHAMQRMQYRRNFYEIKSNDEIFELLKEESKNIGYYSLPFKDIEKITLYSRKVTQKNIVVIGIGGSSLGAKAIYNFLKTSSCLIKNLYFFDTVDPIRLNSLLEKLNLKESHFVVISKSGTTIEPLSILKFIAQLVEINSINTTIITEKDSLLEKFAQLKNINSFEIDKNIGGRFSVFSPVGLLPLSMVGIKVDELLQGCKEVHESFFSKGYFYNHIFSKARFLVENKSRFTNNVVFSYSSVFKEFNKWYEQLWAESLGKININGTRQGLTPISLLGPEDQHSFLQLIIQGVRNKTVTFLKVRDFKKSIKIPADIDFEIFNTDYTDGISFSELINMQADATYEAINKESDIPCDAITIDEINEVNIASLMYRYLLLVSCIGTFLQINTYDQPGVELGKKILISKLKQLKKK